MERGEVVLWAEAEIMSGGLNPVVEVGLMDGDDLENAFSETGARDPENLAADANLGELTMVEGVGEDVGVGNCSGKVTDANGWIESVREVSR